MNAHSVPPEFADLSDESIAELVTAIDRVGYGIVSNYLGRHNLEQLRAFVEDAVLTGGNS
jgi:hypothetical protein